MMNRWQLRKYGKAFILLGAIYLFAAELLSRAQTLARRQAEGAVEYHEFEEHDDD